MKKFPVRIRQYVLFVAILLPACVSAGNRLAAPFAPPCHLSLLQACREGQTELLYRQIAQRKGQINDRAGPDWQGIPAVPLHVAVYCKRPEVVAMLIGAGADPNLVAGSELLSPLAVAAENGDVAMARQLLRFGAGINGGESDRGMPLYRACRQGHIETVNFLLAEGANPDIYPPPTSSTPLYIASQQGHGSIVEALLAAGANVNSGTVYGAVLQGTDTAEELLSAMEVDTSPPVVSALHAAAQHGQTEVIALLTAAKAELNQVTPFFHSPLIAAIVANQRAAVDMLLRYGADSNQASMDGISPLCFAVRGGHVDMARQLLASGAHINGTTPTSPALPARLPCDQSAMATSLFEANRAPNDSGPLVLGNPLCIACRQDDTEMVQWLLNAGAEVNGRVLWRADAIDMTGPAKESRPAERLAFLQSAEQPVSQIEASPLHIAARYGSAAVVEALLQAGANPSSVAKGLHTPLITAICANQAATVVKLLAHGASPRQPALSDMATPLCFAVNDQHIAIAQLLLAAGAEPDAGTTEQITPLLIAAAHGHQEMVKLLLSAANRSERDSSSNKLAALHMAAKKGDTAIAKALIEAGCDVNAPLAAQQAFAIQNCIATLPAAAGAAAFSFARIVAQRREDGILATALSATSSVNQNATGGPGPLYMAALAGHWRLVELLLEHDADPNPALSVPLPSPLWLAVEGGHVEVVRVLLKWGGNPNLKGRGRRVSPLVVAVMQGSQEIVKLLLDAGAQPDVNTGDHAPLLCMAVGAGRIELVRCLLNAGANTSLSNRHSRHMTALQIASQAGKLTVVQLLLHCGADPNKVAAASPAPPALWCAVDHQHSQVVRTLLHEHANPNLTGGAGRPSPLYLAVWQENSEMAKMLLTAGAQADVAPNQDHPTPLFQAARAGHTDMVRLLVGAGANPNRGWVDDQMTPLGIASLKGYVAIARFLISAGADVNQIMMPDIQTAYDFASSQGHDSIVRLLRLAGARTGEALQPAAKKERRKFLELQALAAQEARKDLLKRWADRCLPASVEQRRKQIQH